MGRSSLVARDGGGHTRRVAEKRLAAILAGLSLAGDLGHGRALEHSLRVTYLACRLADALGLDAAARRDAFYVALLQAVGCVGNAHQIAESNRMDDIAFKRDIAVANFLGPGQQLAAVARHVGKAGPAVLRPIVFGRALADMNGRHEHTLAHCEVGALIAQRAALGAGTVSGLFSTFERWDGRGSPAAVRGLDIPLVARVAAVAIAADLFVAANTTVLRSRLTEIAGAALDPDLVVTFLELVERRPPWTVLGSPELWDEVLAQEPSPQLTVVAERIDDLALAFADFADVKAPWFVGHSRNVAERADLAARALGLGALDASLVRRAALLHDVGRASVPNTILDKPRSLTPGERERVRLHPYYTERVLERAPAFAECAQIAGAHHERLDGSGYHRGAKANALPIAARILAAADTFQALSEARPYRGPMTPEQAAAVLRRDAAEGRLDGDVVAAVISTASGAPPRRVRASMALTDRELEVVRLVARGDSNKELARQLEISENTARHHLESIYAKLDARTRTGAVMQALSRGLL